jgi:hypothetical protein
MTPFLFTFEKLMQCSVSEPMASRTIPLQAKCWIPEMLRSAYEKSRLEFCGKVLENGLYGQIVIWLYSGGKKRG